MAIGINKRFVSPPKTKISAFIAIAILNFGLSFLKLYFVGLIYCSNGENYRNISN